MALYALMLVMPLLGWSILSAEGKLIPLFGPERFPLVNLDKALGEQVQEVHETIGTIGTIGYYLIGLRAAASLVHQYFYKDDTLKRMLPGG